MQTTSGSRRTSSNNACGTRSGYAAPLSTLFDGHWLTSSCDKVTKESVGHCLHKCKTSTDNLFRLLQFCQDVPPGHMRAIDCLETNRYESDFSPGCREALEVSIAERQADFRLDPSLRAACSKDIDRRCWQFRFCDM